MGFTEKQKNPFLDKTSLERERERERDTERERAREKREREPQIPSHFLVVEVENF